MAYKSNIELLVSPFYEHYEKACGDIRRIQAIWGRGRPIFFAYLIVKFFVEFIRGMERFCDFAIGNHWCVLFGLLCKQLNINDKNVKTS